MIGTGQIAKIAPATVFCFTLGTIVATSAHADDCLDMLRAAGTPIAPKAAYDRFAKLSLKRDQYETTAQFQQRIAAAGIPASIVVVSRIDPTLGKYDPDSAKLSFTVTDLEMTMHFENLGDIVTPDYWWVAGTRSVKNGPAFIGQNAFGAKTRVATETASIYGIGFLDNTALQTIANETAMKASASGNYSAAVLESSEPTVAISMSPDVAKQSRQFLEFIEVGVPSAPYVKSAETYSEATMDQPIASVEHAFVVLAPAKCVGVLNAKTHEILGAFPQFGTASSQ